MTKNIVERFLIGGSAHHPSMPSHDLQKAIGTKIQVDVNSKLLRVPTEKGFIVAKSGDTIICFDDGSFDVEKGG